uniref:Uncharacterized protein n=1 Tax=Mustela putorius furo TaxID=9669 RepID=M3YIM5_MUSPF
MVKPVPLFRRTDFKLLLCNHKDLFFLRVSKLLDCFSPKSMWFLWNIFSKGTHMLQCLCGKSLKKNKNPTGILLVWDAFQQDNGGLQSRAWGWLPDPAWRPSRPCNTPPFQKWKSKFAGHKLDW